MKRLFICLLLVATALAAVETEDAITAIPLVKPLPAPKIAVSNAAAPQAEPLGAAAAPAKAAVAAVAPVAKAPSPAAPQPKAAAAAAAAAASPAVFSAYTLSAAQATLSPDPATDGLATLILKGLSNATIPRGSAGVLNGALHTPNFLATSFPAGATVELRGSAAAGGGGDWGSCYLRKVSLIASGTADGVAVLSGAVVPASLGDAGQATFGSQRGTLVFNRVSVLVTPAPKASGGGGAKQKLVASAPAPSSVAAVAAVAAKAPSPSPAKNASSLVVTVVSPSAPKVSVAAATRPVASVKSVPMPSEFSN